MRLPDEHKGLKAVALIEAAKGTLVLTAGIGVWSFFQKDLLTSANSFLVFLRLNPESEASRFFLQLVGRANDFPTSGLIGFWMTYWISRMIEAYGLWKEQKWAEWFAAISCSVYIPFEAVHWWRYRTVISLILLAVNLLLVTFLFGVLFSKHGNGKVSAKKL